MRMKTIKSKRGIRWLVVLMTLSLIGITGIQAYWITNSYSIKEEKFDQEVLEALDGVSKRLEAIESVNFIRESFVLEPFLSTKPFFPEDSHLGFDTLKKFAGKAEGVTFSMSINGDTALRLKMDSSKIQLQGTVNNGPDKLYAVNQMPIMLEKVENRMTDLNQVFKKLMIHEARKRGKIAHRLMIRDLDSLLEFELGIKGIETPFEYAVVENSELALKSPNWEPAQQQHKAALFPGDFFGNRLLMVSFPSKANYLLSSMWLTLMISILLTATMIFTFSKTLSYSMRQKRINDVKTDFINNMTHEFKTPIATINLAIDALNNQKVISNPEKIRHYSNVIKQENNRMNMQVESVLRMALMDKKELELNYEPVIIQEVLEDCADHIKLQMEAREGKLNLLFHDYNQEVIADKNHLANTIINILDNAMKYSIGSPEISMKTELTETDLIIIISDKGIGMTKEEQKRIFDRFFRVTSGNIHNVKGHGLGLSYVQGIIEAHGGRINVESEKNKGSKFYIYLPLNKEI